MKHRDWQGGQFQEI